MRIPAKLYDLSSHAVRLFAHPSPGNRRHSWFVVGTFVAFIAIADYFLGLELSLSLFYLIPVTLGAGWFGFRAGVLVAVVSTILRIIGDFISIYPAHLPGFIWWNCAGAFVIYVFVGWLVNTLVTAHHALEGRIAERTSELAQSIAERRRLEIEILDVTARERATVGRELHDDLGQHLVATALAAQVLAQQLGSGSGGKEAQAIVRWLEEAIAKTRKLARGLLVARIEADRFIGELEELTANASQSGIRCRVTCEGAKLRATPSQCAQLFRIAQEAIGNALRHARSTSIEVTVVTDEQATCVIIEDDGAGFEPGKSHSGFGLRIMQHRAQIIGASLAVLSAPGEGTKVVCRLPLNQNSS